MNAGPLIFLAAMVAVFWFLLIRPQRQRQAAHQNLMAQLAPGDEVVTAGGMIGPSVDRDLPRRRDRPGHGVRIAKEAVTGFAEKDEGIRRLGNPKGAANLVRHKWLLVAPICSSSGSRLPRPRHPRDRAPVVALLPVAQARSRPPGRPRDRPSRGAAEGARHHRRRHGPLGRDHAVARRQARRRRAEIRQQGKDQISLQLPGISDPQAAADLVGKTAQLWLFDLQANILEPTAQSQGSAAYPAPMDSLFQLLSTIQPQTKQGRRRSTTSSIRRRRRSSSAPRTRRRGCDAGWGSSRTPGRSSRSASSRTAFPRTGSS